MHYDRMYVCFYFFYSSNIKIKNETCNWHLRHKTPPVLCGTSKHNQWNQNDYWLNLYEKSSAVNGDCITQ